MADNRDEDLTHLLPHKQKKLEKSSRSKRFAALIVVGILTGLYSFAEIGIAVHLDSIALLSDGIHNLSDVISLVIAFWALKKSTSSNSDTMTYGWRRTEILGAVMNGCFLVALSVYIVLEAIPRIAFHPTKIQGSWWFISTAAAGLVVNTVGTILFSVLSGGHGHSHAGGGGHGHSNDEEKPKHKKKKHEHEHKHEHKHSHDESSPHEITQHELIELSGNEQEEEEGHRHGSHKKHDKHHGHKEGHKKKKDYNIHAVFLHYLGDALSSILVLIAGLLAHFFQDDEWTAYLDPVSSLLIVILILITTLPLLKDCSEILLQQVPSRIKIPHLKAELKKVDSVQGIHDLHVWQLVDDVIISSLHVTVYDVDSPNFKSIAKNVKQVMHKFGIHSTTLQPEFIHKDSSIDYCDQNCVKDCPEDWCCKTVVGEKKNRGHHRLFYIC